MAIHTLLKVQNDSISKRDLVRIHSLSFSLTILIVLKALFLAVASSLIYVWYPARLFGAWTSVILSGINI